MTTAEEDTSYIDYETFLSPTFSPSAFANSLVLGTNNPTDSPLDLSTPLSRVLFDAQEIDSHIDTLTTKNALLLLSHTQQQTASSARIVQEIDAQVASLNDGYTRLEKEVLVRYETAEEVRVVAGRLWETVRLGRSVGRCLQLGRQLEVQLSEISGVVSTKAQPQKDDHRALVRCSNTLLSLRELLAKNNPGEEGHGLERVEAIRSLQTSIITPAERSVLSKAQKIVREFSMSNLSPGSSNTATYAQTTDTKARTTSALITLYLLSPIPGTLKENKWEPELLVQALQDYLRTALTSSIASLSRALATLPTLDRTLLEVSARCQNILVLESLLSSTNPPSHLLLSLGVQAPTNFLAPLLTSLETSSLPSYFWRSLAGGLSTKVQEIISKGGVSARTLKSNKNSVRDAIRDCVVRGSQAPVGMGTIVKGDKKGEGSWEREVAVMVGSVVGSLGR